MAVVESPCIRILQADLLRRICVTLAHCTIIVEPSDETFTVRKPAEGGTEPAAFTASAAIANNILYLIQVFSFTFATNSQSSSVRCSDSLKIRQPLQWSGKSYRRWAVVNTAVIALPLARRQNDLAPRYTLFQDRCDEHVVAH